MRASRHCRRVIPVLLVLFGLISVTASPGDAPIVHAQGDYDPAIQTPVLLYDEARTIYLGNLARRDQGIAPLRWNRQLTHAARWFSWDSVDNRPGGYCGHQDTLGRWPVDRVRIFGYLGWGGAENAFCPYVTPEVAIQGWLDSPGHRANLLDPNSREIGVGYYRRNSDGRGYVTQNFGNDAVYAPVIIENEALSTINSNVNLYIYNRSTGGGFTGLSPATQMMISNNPSFNGAAWEPYNPNKAWTLETGNGWREVFVKTRDRFNRTLTVSDTIYVGPNVPLNELGAAQMSTRQSQVTLNNLNGGSLPQVQFSLGWLADDTADTFQKLWGNGERVNDASAWGGTAFRLFDGAGESSVWVWDTSFIKGVPMVAYVRLKVNDNTSSSEVARFAIEGGGTTYGPLSLRGTDFSAPNQYQEFTLNFTFNSNPNDGFLIFQFWRSGSADVYVDAVSIFTAPQPVTSPLTWSVPGGNYRGQGIWVRYTNGNQFSAISEAEFTQAFPLNVDKTGNGDGTVTSRPAGINCGSDCSEIYSFTNTVTLTAVPATGSAFTGWSGDCTGRSTCTVDMTAARSVTASFARLAGKASLVSPSGMVNSNPPMYIWNTVDDATWYYLWVDGPSGNVLKKWYTAAQANCSGATCSVAGATLNLGNGSYTWWVQTWNDAGYGPWSDGMTFTVPAPGKATLISPAGSVGTGNPTYSWNKVSEATWYYLWVNGPSGNVLKQWYSVAQANCSGATCSVAGATPNLANGSYTWWVQTWNDTGYGPWSDGKSFAVSVGLPGQATLISPTGTPGTSNPTYTWDQVNGATWYYLWVNGPSGNVIKQWYTAAQASCNGNTCSIAPSRTLETGSHTWWVQTWSSAGYGPWSDRMDFSTP